MNQLFLPSDYMKRVERNRSTMPGFAHQFEASTLQALFNAWLFSGPLDRYNSCSLSISCLHNLCKAVLNLVVLISVAVNLVIKILIGILVAILVVLL